jgi:hypothetical protein
VDDVLFDVCGLRIPFLQPNFGFMFILRSVLLFADSAMTLSDGGRHWNAIIHADAIAQCDLMRYTNIHSYRFHLLWFGPFSLLLLVGLQLSWCHKTGQMQIEVSVSMHQSSICKLCTRGDLFHTPDSQCLMDVL